MSTSLFSDQDNAYPIVPVIIRLDPLVDTFFAESSLELTKKYNKGLKERVDKSL